MSVHRYGNHLLYKVELYDILSYFENCLLYFVIYILEK